MPILQQLSKLNGILEFIPQLYGCKAHIIFSIEFVVTYKARKVFQVSTETEIELEKFL